MSPSLGFLLDTNVVLHATRENSPVASAMESQFQLRTSPFQPAICEVTVAELWAFAQSWGDRRKQLLQQVISNLVVVPISDSRIHHRWAELHSHAQANGLAIQHDDNDIWIGATAGVTGLRLLTMDGRGFLPLRGTSWLDVVVLNPKTAIIVP
ncbi:MAG TPA: PIN domain-containing protein [Candidatus Limnocylindria bacterium]|jgi:predicted nucleic acid-binding protein|nr:PIN domain-containing protein [Candidatus Limnocylindria bacterium]